MKLPLVLSVMTLLLAAPVCAQVAMSGSFTATQACPAYQSIRKQTNPGAVMLIPGRTYQAIGKNKDVATHYEILVDGAAPAQRWVEISCGTIGTASAAVPPVTVAAAVGARATHVLALSWEPSFCAKHSDKVECKRETTHSVDATHLSLHGLWPQPRGRYYCNVEPALVAADKNHQWTKLPEPDLSAATRLRLAAVMPGFQSGLERHEWIVHGTCYGGTADAYFNRAAALVEQVDASPVRELFVHNVGKSLSSDAIRSTFEQAFGQGAGARVTVSCQGQGTDREITEIDIALAGEVTGTAPLKDLIRAAGPAPQGCPAGLVAEPAR